MTPDEMRAIQARDLLTEDITRFLLAEFGQPVAWVEDELGTPQEWISVVGDARKIADALVGRFDRALSAHPAEETEYAYQDEPLPGMVRTSEAFDDFPEMDVLALWQAEGRWLVRRRKAGPWEPVPTNANADGEGD